TIASDASWLVTYEDKEWIDASGKTSDQSGTTWLQAGAWNFDAPESLPSAFKLPTEAQKGDRVTSLSKAFRYVNIRPEAGVSLDSVSLLYDVYDAYQYTGDKAQVQQLYPRMHSLMDYCLGRRNKDGLMEGLAGDWPYVLKEMKSYWGGMLDLGATSFWEEYDPTKKGAEHLA
nr:hypothetical protein [Tanacetum cinerariifolium]